jgi:hypothetical protein
MAKTGRSWVAEIEKPEEDAISWGLARACDVGAHCMKLWGRVVTGLPPYKCNWSPMELVWSQWKRCPIRQQNLQT